MTQKSITQIDQNFKFSPHGYPLAPDGRMYIRAEIVSDPAIPLPLFVDAANPPAYWQRRTGAEMAAEAKRITDRNRRNAQARERRQTTRNGRMVTMATIIAAPTLALVERVNAADKFDSPSDKFAAETNEPPKPEQPGDGPQTRAESIMDLLGQDYRAARVSAETPIRKPTAEESQRALDLALNPGKMNIAAPQRWQFGRGR